MKVHYQSRIRLLEGYNYFEGLSDKGVGVSEKAKELSELMNNPEKLEEERTKSKDLRKKLGKFDSGFKDTGEHNPKYGGISHDMQDPYKMSYDEDSIRTKKKDVFDKDREISFNKKEEDKPKSESRSNINEHTYEKSGNSKKIEEDFDFTETIPTTKQKATPTQNSVNFLDEEPTETPVLPEKKEKDKPQPISMNLLDDLNFGPAESKKNIPLTFNLADSLNFKQEVKNGSPMLIAALNEEQCKKGKEVKKPLMDDFEEFQGPPPIKQEAKKDIWNQYEDILNIGDLSQAKKVESKSMLLI